MCRFRRHIDGFSIQQFIFHKVPPRGCGHQPSDATQYFMLQLCRCVRRQVKRKLVRKQIFIQNQVLILQLRQCLLKHTSMLCTHTSLARIDILIYCSRGSNVQKKRLCRCFYAFIYFFFVVNTSLRPTEEITFNSN